MALSLPEAEMDRLAQATATGTAQVVRDSWSWSLRCLNREKNLHVSQSVRYRCY
jgi:hypothetical protein